MAILLRSYCTEFTRWLTLSDNLCKQLKPKESQPKNTCRRAKIFNLSQLGFEPRCWIYRQTLNHVTVNRRSVFIYTVELWSLELACVEHQGSLELICPYRQFPYTFNVKIHPRLEQRCLELSNSKHGPRGDFSCKNAMMARTKYYFTWISHTLDLSSL